MTRAASRVRKANTGQSTTSENPAQRPTDSNGQHYEPDRFRPCKSPREPAQTEDCSPHKLGKHTVYIGRITLYGHLNTI